MTTGSLSADSIAANNITSDKIKTDSIVARHILSDEIDTDHLKANSITTVTLAASAVTSQKISSGTIASEAMIASNIITGVSISSNAVVTGSVTSKNFDGSYNADTGLIDAGTEGFFLEGNTGTIVANTLVARDDIITGNMIQFSSGKALSAGPNGDLQVVVDDETLSVQDGKLAIKTVPQTAVFTPVGDITYSGATSEKGIGIYSSIADVNTGDRFGIAAGHMVYPYTRIDTGIATYRSHSNNMFTIDLQDHGLGGNADAIKSITLYNLTFEVDYTNILNLAAVDGLAFLGVQAVASDILTDFTNTGTVTRSRFFQITNPTLPVAKVDYTLTQFNCKPVLNDTNRYIHVFPFFNFSNSSNFDENDTIAIKIKASTDMRLTINATGSLSNTNRSMQDLLDVTAENQSWEDGLGFSYDDSVFN